MKTDYKFWYIKREDNVHITECAVRFYEGEVTTENELDILGNPQPVTRYRRTKQLKKVHQPHFKKIKTVKDAGGNDVLLFTEENFGIIKTNDELRLFLNGQLKNDKSRSPIDEQK